jgi:hypothetical protein
LVESFLSEVAASVNEKNFLAWIPNKFVGIDLKWNEINVQTRRRFDCIASQLINICNN